MKGEHVQNFEILGTIFENKKKFDEICIFLDELTQYVNKRYNERSDLFALYKIDENIFFTVVLTDKGKYNPYYAIFNRNDNSIKFYADIKLVSCLLDEKDELKAMIESCYKYNIGYNIANKKIIEHIKLYDSIREKYPNINSVEFENNYEELFDVSEREDDDYEK